MSRQETVDQGVSPHDDLIGGFFGLTAVLSVILTPTAEFGDPLRPG